MKTRLTLFLFTILSITCHCQNLVEIYKNFIPSNFRKDSHLSEQIENTLRTSAKINPELIFYQLVRYNKSGSSQIDSEFYLNFIEHIQNEFLLQRKQWALTLIEKLNCNKDSRYYIEAKNLLGEFAEYSPASKVSLQNTISFDSVSIDEVLVIFYSQYFSIETDSIMNVSEKRCYSENLRRSELISLKRMGNYEKGDKFLSELINNWYLFPLDRTYNVDDTTSLTFDQILIKAVREKYHVVTRGELSIEAGLSSAFNSINYNFVGPEELYNLELPLPHQTIGLSIALSYKYFFENTISAFSYLKFRFFYSYIKSDQSGTDEDQHKFYNNEFETENYRFRVKSGRIASTLNTYLLQIGIPVFQHSPYFVLECISCIGCSRFAYGVSYLYIRNKRTNTEGEKNRTEVRNENIYGVGLEMNIRLPKNISIAATGMIPSRVQLMVSYGIPL